MTWKYKYKKDEDVTEIYFSDEKIGHLKGEITSWSGRLPRGEAKEIVLSAVSDPMTASLLYGFDKIREEKDNDPES